MVIRSRSRREMRFDQVRQGQRWLPLIALVLLPLAAPALSDVSQPPPEMLAQAEPTAPVKKPPPAETAPNNKGVVQLLNQVEALNGELSRLRGQIEVLTNDINNAQKRQRDMYVDLDTRLRRI
ncbi:MAG TPA: YbgF trimerization domain-containing protein [Burkholderiales bacterium]|nr:YbgF trimerization domain-containing protein [Burkholderiales bacterium]